VPVLKYLPCRGTACFMHMSDNVVPINTLQDTELITDPVTKDFAVALLLKDSDRQRNKEVLKLSAQTRTVGDRVHHTLTVMLPSITHGTDNPYIKIAFTPPYDLEVYVPCILLRNSLEPGDFFSIFFRCGETDHYGDVVDDHMLLFECDDPSEVKALLNDALYTLLGQEWPREPGLP